MPDPTKRMDRAEIARRVERAEKLLQKGKTGEALDEYMQVLADDPQKRMPKGKELSAELRGELIQELARPPAPRPSPALSEP